MSISFGHFHYMLSRLPTLDPSVDPRARAAAFDALARDVFFAMDADGSQTIDETELLAGLTTLLGGAKFAQGAQAAFELFDADGNRRLDAGEFGRFLAAHFRVLYRTTPAVRDRMDGEGVSPEELAATMAASSFEEIVAMGEDGGGGGDARAQQAKKKNKMDTTS